MPTFLRTAALAVLALSATNATAQTLYKYVDQDGKVTYSDKPPKPGEAAVPVKPAAGNTVKLPPKAGKAADPKKAAEPRTKQRERLLDDVRNAEKALADARKALEEGSDPQPGEQQIIVRKEGNLVLRNDAYRQRIAALEAAVKAAEKRLEDAERNYRRGAPD